MKENYQVITRENNVIFEGATRGKIANDLGVSLSMVRDSLKNDSEIMVEGWLVPLKVIKVVSSEKKPRKSKYDKPTSININGKIKSHPVYDCWRNLPVRCSGKYPQWRHYKEAGIKVCEEWLNSYDTFYDWAIQNGWKYGMTIDRIDNNGDYTPENCRWISKSENSKKMFQETGMIDRIIPPKKCYTYDIKTNTVREYNSTAELVKDIWGKTNNGYFNHAYKIHSLVKERYYVGYDPELLKSFNNNSNR